MVVAVVAVGATIVEVAVGVVFAVGSVVGVGVDAAVVVVCVADVAVMVVVAAAVVVIAPSTFLITFQHTCAICALQWWQPSAKHRMEGHVVDVEAPCKSENGARERAIACFTVDKSNEARCMWPHQMDHCGRWRCWQGCIRGGISSTSAFELCGKLLKSRTSGMV